MKLERWVANLRHWGGAGSEVETWILWNYDEKSVKISDQEKVSSKSILAWLLSVSVSVCFLNLAKSFWEHFAMCLISSVWLYLSWAGDGSGVKVTFVAVRRQTRQGSVLRALPKCYNYTVYELSDQDMNLAKCSPHTSCKVLLMHFLWKHFLFTSSNTSLNEWCWCKVCWSVYVVVLFWVTRLACPCKVPPPPPFFTHITPHHAGLWNFIHNLCIMIMSTLQHYTTHTTL